MALVSLLLVMTACSGEEAPSQAEVSEPAPVSEPEERSEASAPVPELPTYPVGEMGFTAGRLAYEDGDMWLILPRLDLEEPVYTDPMDLENFENNNLGISDATLENGICMFGAAILPGEAANANTSLAGHRDIGGMEFYYLDTVTDGDLIYLDYDGNRYTYLYESTTIVNDDDWEPVRTKEYSCLTLQTCHPINKATHRMFVVARLIEVTPMDKVDKSSPPAATIDGIKDADA